ncbi:unnamed protein product [Oikopleura dioica]|uniref:EGF-like domain-containing protein n=1 Tax=Oikopleura dioica TaxID=34765 RepID=E4XY88_OIKDI|nr:unnamed protein product [Oikopleura dioica]
MLIVYLVAYLKWKYNIVIPGRAKAMGSNFPGSHGFPVNLWPRSPSKPLTVVPVLISDSFERAVIEEVYDVLNRLTSQSDCVEFRWITHADLGDYANWISLKPGSDCRTTVGLPSIEDGFRGGEVTLELGNDCQKTPAVLRTMLLHAVGTSPVRATIGGRRVSTNEPTAYKLCSTSGPYATCQGSSCKELGGKGWEILRSAVTVEEAKRRCKELFGMELASIQSPEEQRVVNFMLQTDDQGLERAKFWTGNNVVGKNLGQWRGNWASGFPQKHRNSAPVYMSYSASGWEWRNDININSKFPAICEASSISKSSKCLNNLCSSQATCAEKGSAYSCRCNDGYFGNGFQCSPTSCPAGTVRHGETCVIDPCNSCKPRFACEAVNAGTHGAQCSCKAGWTGSGQLCLPQKKSTTTKAALSPTTLPPFNRFAAEFLPSSAQSYRGATESMKKSGAMASLTRRLEL